MTGEITRSVRFHVPDVYLASTVAIECVWIRDVKFR